MEPVDSSPETMCPSDWHDLITAAQAAGRWAARELARQCSLWELGRSGQVWIHIEPATSPIADWLLRQGQAYTDTVYSGVLVPVEITAPQLLPAGNPAGKATSLLVARAYAAAYCTVLAEEAAVTTEIHLMPSTLPQSQETTPPGVNSTETPSGLAPPQPTDT